MTPPFVSTLASGVRFAFTASGFPLASGPYLSQTVVQQRLASGGVLDIAGIKRAGEAVGAELVFYGALRSLSLDSRESAFNGSYHTATEVVWTGSATLEFSVVQVASGKILCSGDARGTLQEVGYREVRQTQTQLPILEALSAVSENKALVNRSALSRDDAARSLADATVAEFRRYVSPYYVPVRAR